MLEAIESDRKRNSRRSDYLGEDRSQSSCEKLKCVWFDFRHPCKRKQTLMVNYIPYMDFMAKQVSSGPFLTNLIVFMCRTQRDGPPFAGWC